MKNWKMTLAASALIFSTSLNAQVLNSGDKDLDGSLKEINIEAKADLTGFKAGVKTEFGIGDTKINLMLKTMEPSDLFMAATIAKITMKPIEVVTASYTKNKTKGWGVIAKEMGIKPGSAEFHKLKNATKSKHDKMKNKGKGSSNKPTPAIKAKGSVKEIERKGKPEKAVEPGKAKHKGTSGKMVEPIKAGGK